MSHRKGPDDPGSREMLARLVAGADARERQPITSTIKRTYLIGHEGQSKSVSTPEQRQKKLAALRAKLERLCKP